MLPAPVFLSWVSENSFCNLLSAGGQVTGTGDGFYA